ncbi:ABC transporter permease subunit, partial [Microbacterium laevaniformans]|uniref:ABC transporter permease subunit n=1 Tax=Microbacterium laevaniformans TaxID=36807 RepID=UPI0031F11598
MEGFRIPIGQWAEAVVDTLSDALRGFFDAAAFVLRSGLRRGGCRAHGAPVLGDRRGVRRPRLRGQRWRLAGGTALGLLLIVAVDQLGQTRWTRSRSSSLRPWWRSSSRSRRIWAARNDTASRIVRPVLDFLQTMPAFVYLIPAIIFFGVGAVPGMIATILFAIAPGVRLTELGIRGVDTEVVEAGYAFGASPARVLRQ